MPRFAALVALLLVVAACTDGGVGGTRGTTVPTTVPVASTQPPDIGPIDLVVDGEVVVVPAGAEVALGSVTASDVVLRSAADPVSSGGADFVTERFEVGVERGIVFRDAPVAVGTRPLRLDVYTPVADGRSDRPGFVAIHGGGFLGGSRLAGPPAMLCESLAARGHVCISIEYRLVRDDAPTGEGPVLPRTIAAAVEDATAAVSWLRTNSGRLGVDPDRISIGGSSAGAITALLTAFTVDGIDLHRVVDLWGGMYDEVDAIGPGGPPVLVVHGVLDRTVSFLLAEQLIAELAREGVPFVAYPFPDEGHGVPLDAEVAGVSLLDLVADFVGS